MLTIDTVYTCETEPSKMNLLANCPGLGLHHISQFSAECMIKILQVLSTWPCFIHLGVFVNVYTYVYNSTSFPQLFI